MESSRREKRGMNRSGEEQFPRTQSNRTLSDIIRADSRGDSHYYEGKKSWKHFKDKLRRRRGAAWTSTFATPTSDMPINNRSMNRRPSGGFSNDPARSDISAVPDVDPELTSNPRNSGPAMLQRNSSRAIERASGRFEHDGAPRMRTLQREENSDEDEEEDEDDEGSEEEEGGSDDDEEGEHPVRMSLMSLLAETDKQLGLDGSSYILGEDDDEEDEEEERGGGGEYSNCCICMVRHKGAAFIPCGHTFCRLCSREMWVQKGNNCPLCNNYILEILDIF